MIGLDPTQTTGFSLPLDAQKPEAERAVFITRFLTTSKSREIRRLIDAALEETDNDRADAMALDALKLGMVGWRRVKDEAGKDVAFDWKAADELLTFPEKCQLGWGMIRATRLSEWDLFQSGSVSASRPAESASGAKPGSVIPSQTKTA